MQGFIARDRLSPPLPVAFTALLQGVFTAGEDKRRRAYSSGLY